jgi:hypothetical protein
MENSIDRSAAMEGPPMIPLICHSAEFVFSTDLDARNFSRNLTMVHQLADSLKCWISHAAEVQATIDAGLAEIDTVLSPPRSIASVYATLLRHEVLSSFHLHFDRDEVAAVRRVLQYVPSAAALLVRLDGLIADLKVKHAEAANAVEYIGLVGTYVPADGAVWDVAEVPDAAPPLFSGLRATFVCCTLFGAAHRPRFNALVDHVIWRVEEAVAAAGRHVLRDICDRPACQPAVKQRIVVAQDAAVTLQEAYYDLVQGLADAGGVLFGGVAAGDMVFDTIDWQYARLALLLKLTEVLREQPHKIGTALTDGLVAFDLMHGEGITQENLLREIERVDVEDVTTPNDILDRMGIKAAKMATIAAEKKEVLAVTTTALVVTFSFDPPTITVAGGPLQHECLEAIATITPMSCSNVASGMMRMGAVGVPKLEFARLSDSAVRLTVENRFCDDAARSHVMVTALDCIEADGWVCVDSHGTGDGPLEVFTLFLKRRVQKHAAA